MERCAMTLRTMNGQTDRDINLYIEIVKFEVICSLKERERQCDK
jgi:hypothetical protein